MLDFAGKQSWHYEDLWLVTDIKDEVRHQLSITTMEATVRLPMFHAALVQCCMISKSQITCWDSINAELEMCGCQQPLLAESGGLALWEKMTISNNIYSVWTQISIQFNLKLYSATSRYTCTCLGFNVPERWNRRTLYVFL